MSKDEQINLLFNIAAGIKKGNIELLQMSEKKNKDFSWDLNVKILVKKEIEDLKKNSITFKETDN
jgi:hypothetical protein